eukprot:2516403-Pleurochrysis_carterae.AAC.6
MQLASTGRRRSSKLVYSLQSLKWLALFYLVSCVCTLRLYNRCSFLRAACFSHSLQFARAA